MAFDREVEHRINTLKKAMNKFWKENDMERYQRTKLLIRRLRKESTAETTEQALYRSVI